MTKQKDSRYYYVMKSDANKVAKRISGRVIGVKFGKGKLFKIVK